MTYSSYYSLVHDEFSDLMKKVHKNMVDSDPMDLGLDAHGCPISI
tara:strand:- start:333 stop:467 length:135 start_codon:yes stop_codon:yes gene_type:complete